MDTKMWKEILQQPEALQRCKMENGAVIRELAEKIKEQNIGQVIFAARGTSGHAAVYGKYIIELLAGIPVSLSSPSIFTIYDGNLNFSNAVVIGISQSGKAADVLEVIRSANNRGALTVGISNNPSSEIAVESKYFLSCSAGEEKSVAATKTFSTQIFLLAMLVAELVGDQKLLEEIYIIPQNVSRVFDTADIIQNNVERYRFMNECFVLARGINYSISLEAALKIQETTYVRAKAFSTSDFQHGPIAMIESNIPVMVFAPDGPSVKDVSEMIERLRKEQIETIVISNNKSIAGLGKVSFSIPETSNDIISPFYNVVVAQMFACKLAKAKGFNPDSPRRLNKVTVTR